MNGSKSEEGFISVPVDLMDRAVPFLPYFVKHLGDFFQAPNPKPEKQLYQLWSWVACIGKRPEAYGTSGIDARRCRTTVYAYVSTLEIGFQFGYVILCLSARKTTTWTQTGRVFVGKIRHSLHSTMPRALLL